MSDSENVRDGSELQHRTRVGHCRRDRTDEYIGRAGDGGERTIVNTAIHDRGWLGNPFRLDDGWDRVDSVENFRNVFVWRLRADSDFRTAVRNLHGKRLGCWCQELDDDGPLCHGEVIAEYADKLVSGEFEVVRK
jgi:hypothetical protein